MKIKGNVYLRKQLAQAFKNKALGHSLLFSGKEGIGKYLYAKEFASYLLCENVAEENIPLGGCGECRVCALLKTNSCPELVEVFCKEENTEKIKTTISELYKEKVAAKRRVVIFRDAEYLRVQGANSLLKSIEEPPKNTFFILTCANAELLLPTIRSRCQKWHFNPLQDEEVKEIIKENLNLLPSQFAVKLSAGSPALALLLLEEEELVKDIFNTLLKISQGDDQIIAPFLNQLLKIEEKEKVINFLLLCGSYFLEKSTDLNLVYKWAL
ncbi:MAG: AAA family ATPase, partial [Candidatus Dadabacteria bacterium]